MSKHPRTSAHEVNVAHLADVLYGTKYGNWHECFECWKRCTVSEIRVLCKFDEGVWIDLQLCPECAEEFLKNGEWRE